MYSGVVVTLLNIWVWLECVTPKVWVAKVVPKVVILPDGRNFERFSAR